jgi:hypothetical protein
MEWTGEAKQTEMQKHPKNRKLVNEGQARQREQATGKKKLGRK